MNLSTTIAVEECSATIVKALGSLPDVTQWEKKRFGSAGLSISGKIFAMRVHGKLVIKLPKARVDVLIERRVGERFVLGQKRMKEWVVLEPISKEHWLSLSREAMEFVASLERDSRSPGLDQPLLEAAYRADFPAHELSSPLHE
jgi:hypothetical protein